MERTSTRRLGAVCAVLALTATTMVGAGASYAANDKTDWVTTWGAAITGPSGTPGNISNGGFNDQSVRMLVRTSVAGKALRIRLSNQWGSQAVAVGHVTVAKPNTATPEAYDIDPATLVTLTFGGSPTTTMYKGTDVLSDPVTMKTDALGDLVVSLYLPTATGPVPWHWQARQQAYVYAGDQTTSATGSGALTLPINPTSYYYLAGVDVIGKKADGAVVVLGDSISDGFAATFGSNNRWPNLLASRIIGTPANNKKPAVVNVSLSGSQLTHDGPSNAVGVSALARMEGDVFGQADESAVIVQLGINDVLLDDSAARVIDALKQISAQLHEQGLTALVCTLGPFEGYSGFTAAREAVRQQVNAYIRTTDDFDAVVDLEQALRDPANPTKVLPAFDSGDHLHPNDAGAQAIADAVPLNQL